MIVEELVDFVLSDLTGFKQPLQDDYRFCLVLPFRFLRDYLCDPFSFAMRNTQKIMHLSRWHQFVTLT